MLRAAWTLWIGFWVICALAISIRIATGRQDTELPSWKGWKSPQKVKAERNETETPYTSTVAEVLREDE